MADRFCREIKEMEEDAVMLWKEEMEEVVMLEKKHEPDGQGGFIVEWQEGIRFNAVITFDSSTEARVAEKQGVTSVYTVTAPVNVKLEYHDVFRRLRDGKVFRVTTDGDDMITPARASFQFLQVSAEEWELA